MISYIKGHLSLRLGKYRFIIKDTKLWPLLFSQKNGDWKSFSIGKYWFGMIKE